MIGIEAHFQTGSPPFTAFIMEKLNGLKSHIKNKSSSFGL